MKVSISFTIMIIMVINLIFLNPDNLCCSGLGTIIGEVRDKETGEPIYCANVIEENYKFGACTDSSGEYTIVQIPPGQYNLEFSSVSYNQITRENVIVSADSITRVDLKLLRLQPFICDCPIIVQLGKIVGTVTDISSHKPIQNVCIVEIDSFRFGTFTDSLGEFCISNIYPGIYELRVIADSYHIITVKEVCVHYDLTTEANIELTPDSLKLVEYLIRY